MRLVLIGGPLNGLTETTTTTNKKTNETVFVSLIFLALSQFFDALVFGQMVNFKGLSLRKCL